MYTTENTRTCKFVQSIQKSTYTLNYKEITWKNLNKLFLFLLKIQKKLTFDDSHKSCRLRFKKNTRIKRKFAFEILFSFVVFHLGFNGTVWLPIRKDKRVMLKRFKATRFGNSTCFSKGYSKLKVKLAQVTSLPRFTQATSHLPLWNFVTAITLLPNINMKTFKPRSYSLKTVQVIFDSQEDASENNNCSFNNH